MTAKLRVSEIYPSIQCEGPRVGQPTVFLRFAGCNLKCPGWPCDTQYAIDPKIYRKDAHLLTVDEVVTKTAYAAQSVGATNVCLTGGEPFLQNSEVLREVAFQLNNRSLALEAFTNGHLVPDWTYRELVAVVLDYKLPGSGEKPFDISLLSRSLHRPTLKFTIKDRADFDEARRVWKEEVEPLKYYTLQTYAGVVWPGTGAMAAADLVDLILQNKLPWKFNYQLHKVIWFEDERGR